MKKKILVLCTGNSCRSQMAEGFLKKLGGDKLESWSAGIEAHGLNPKAVEVMREIGIDISGHESKTVDQIPNQEFDIVLTVCDNAYENCPYFPAKTLQIHKDFPDPAKSKDLQKYREVRDDIGVFIQKLIGELI